MFTNFSTSVDEVVILDNSGGGRCSLDFTRGPEGLKGMNEFWMKISNGRLENVLATEEKEGESQE